MKTTTYRYVYAGSRGTEWNEFKLYKNALKFAKRQKKKGFNGTIVKVEFTKLPD